MLVSQDSGKASSRCLGDDELVAFELRRYRDHVLTLSILIRLVHGEATGDTLDGGQVP